MGYYQNNRSYFEWQKAMGRFGARVDYFKFSDYIQPDSVVVDFGCSGGYMLQHLNCKGKLGVEANSHARREAENNGIDTVETVAEIPDRYADLIISHHALEHVDDPVQILRSLKNKLKDEGRLIFVVPHQDIHEEFNPNDQNRHLYTWNKQTLGNLFLHAGFRVLSIDLIQHQWPPNYEELYRQNGENEFHRLCQEYAKKNQNYQLRIVAEKVIKAKIVYQVPPGRSSDLETPVILLTYNRPRHTHRVLEALRKFNRQNLYLFSDGPGKPSEAKFVEKTRKLLKTVNWCRPNLILRDENTGCAESVLLAIDHVLKKHEKFILLEDDCVPERYFFDFMEECLTKYQNNERIYGVCGYTVPVEEEILKQYPYDLYFLPRIGCWGWGTWKSRWTQYEKSLHEAYRKAISKNLDFDQCGNDIQLMLLSQLTGKLNDNWDLNWMLTVYLREGLFIYPTGSHITNIGMDGSGIHCGRTDRYDTKLAAKRPFRYPSQPRVERSLVKNYRKFYDLPGRTRTGSKRKIGNISEPRVVHLCTLDQGGAGIAAYRLHRGLLNIGVASTMLVLNKTIADPSIKVLPAEPCCQPTSCIKMDSYRSVRWIKNMRRWNTLHKMYPHRPPQQEFFTDIFSELRLDTIKEITEADIINLHWVAGLIDYPNANQWLKDKTVVWTLHDMNPFTGGCHFAGNCDRYRENCGACPQLGSQDLNDHSRQFWESKQFAYRSKRFQIVAPSEWLRRCATESKLFANCPNRVIHNGIPAEIFRPVDKAQARQKLGLSEHADILLFGADSVGNARKGFKYLCEAIRRIKPRKNDDALLLTFGHIPMGLQVPDNFPVQNLGHIADSEQLVRIYNAADLFIIPSLADNLPNTAVEAIACGVPVVGFNSGGIPDIIDHHKTGYLAKPGDVNSLKDGIEWVLKTKSEGVDFSKNCRRRALEKFSQAEQAKAYAGLYRELMQVRAPKTVSEYEAINKSSINKFTPNRSNRHPHFQILKSTPISESEKLESQYTLREKMANFWLNVPESKIADLYMNGCRKGYLKVFNFGVRGLPVREKEKPLLEYLDEKLQGDNRALVKIKTLMTSMLYYYPYQMPALMNPEDIPAWLRDDYFRFLLSNPKCYWQLGDLDRHYNCLCNIVSFLYDKLQSKPESELWRRFAHIFVKEANFLWLYFVPEKLKALYQKRSEIGEFVLNSSHQALDWKFARRNNRNGKIKLGIYMLCILPYTETFATLPVFEYLNPDEFEIYIYVQSNQKSGIEKYVRDISSKFTVLTDSVKHSVETIRNDDLDIFFFGVNLTAISGHAFFLANHRLARNQCIHFCNPVSTGQSKIDYFLLGDLVLPKENSTDSYSETIIELNGSGICFDLKTEHNRPKINLSRKDIGIDSGRIIFISGANFYKITPELRHVWAAILREVANSVLILYPFGPAWSKAYPKNAMVSNLEAVLSRYGIGKDRLLVLDTLGSREEIVSLQKIADIYLDALPYNGATSLLDPLEAGLPTIVMEGQELRFRQGAAILRELGLPELVVKNEKEYIDLAVTLSRDADLRRDLRQNISMRMQSNPPFLDPKNYAQQTARAFKKMVNPESQSPAIKL